MSICQILSGLPLYEEYDKSLESVSQYGQVDEALRYTVSMIVTVTCLLKNESELLTRHRRSSGDDHQAIQSRI